MCGIFYVYPVSSWKPETPETGEPGISPAVVYIKTLKELTVPSVTVNRVYVCVQISEVDFLDSVLVLGFCEELNQILLQVTFNLFYLSELIWAMYTLNQALCLTVYCTAAEWLRVFVSAVPAAPKSDP